MVIVTSPICPSSLGTILYCVAGISFLPKPRSTNRRWGPGVPPEGGGFRPRLPGLLELDACDGTGHMDDYVSPNKYLFTYRFDK